MSNGICRPPYKCEIAARVGDLGQFHDFAGFHRHAGLLPSNRVLTANLQLVSVVDNGPPGEALFLLDQAPIQHAPFLLRGYPKIEVLLVTIPLIDEMAEYRVDGAELAAVIA